jgi:hypothetical protein
MVNSINNKPLLSEAKREYAIGLWTTNAMEIESSIA